MLQPPRDSEAREAEIHGMKDDYIPDAIARHRPLIEAEARAAPNPAPLDVERVGRIFHDRLDQSVLGHAGPVCQPCRQNAKAFAREYAVLEEPTNE